jgi:hypothetical protein
MDDIREELRRELEAAGIEKTDPTYQRVGMKGDVYAVLTKEVHHANNIITDAGDTYYAEQGANEAPTNFADSLGAFTGVVGVATAANTPGKASTYSDVTPAASGEDFPDSGYPQTNDPDGDNPGTVATDVITYRVSYTTGEANATLTHAYITEASPTSVSPLLSLVAFSPSFTKTASDTLKVYVNHTFLGS